MTLTHSEGARGLETDPLPTSPAGLLGAWFAEAKASDRIRNADAMALATVDGEGFPKARFVLCRGRDLARGRFSFYTNYESAKGQEIAAHPKASAAFYWDPLGRQVRLTGRVERVSQEASDAYWASRPPPSQLAAWASDQSKAISDRSALERRFEAAQDRFGDGSAEPIPRPPHWGGFVLIADRIELWSDRAGRLHDRAVWTRAGGDSGSDSPREEEMPWRVERLQP